MSGDGGAFRRLKQLAGLGGEVPDRPYVCRTCEADLDLEYHVCPECGGFTVELRETRAR